MKEKINNQPITETLEKNYMPYAMSVIISRAIPEIDGFKPSHRKLLYTMYKMGLLKGNKVKSADVVGQTMRLNPHGDMSIYETLVRLTRGNEALLHPFIDSKGNFGKQNSKDMAYAASRYTEVKLDKICEEIFKNIDKETVQFVDNYNNSTKEPMLLPTTFPNVLVTPNHGIAVGMASTICSFNLNEICETTIEYIKNPGSEVIKTLLGPDFSTGGEVIYNEKEFIEIYRTGRGSFKVRSKYRFDEKNNCIEIYEIPYTTTIEAISDKIIGLIKSNKIKEITDVRDETDINGLKLTLDIKKNSDPHKMMNRLFKQTPLLDNFNCNFNILVNRRPQVLGVKGIIEEWVNFRVKAVIGQTKYNIREKEAKLNLLKGLSKILMDIDKAIEIIRKTEEDKKVIPNLMVKFEIDKEQAEYIAEIKLRNLNKEYLLNRVKEENNLEKELKALKELLENRNKINRLIIKELKYVSKKYGKERKTNIIAQEDIEELSEEHLIEDYDIKVFLTKDGYLKKITLASLRSASKQKLKENDEIMHEIESTNKDDLILFSSKQNVYKIRSYEINDCKASSVGEYVNNILPLLENEQIIYITTTKDYSGEMIFVYETGKINKVPLELYKTKVNRRKLVKAYSDKEKLVLIKHIFKNVKICCELEKNKVVRIKSKDIEMKKSKITLGTQMLQLKKDTVIKKSVIE